MNTRPTVSRPETHTDILRHFIGMSPFERLQVNTGNYPYHNIEQLSEDQYKLTLAIAGFKIDEVNISLNKGYLTISGTKKNQETSTKFLYQGISYKNFIREFKLGENVEVVSAQLEDGLLEILLERVTPEDEQVKHIPIRKIES